MLFKLGLLSCLHTFWGNWVKLFCSKMREVVENWWEKWGYWVCTEE